MQYIRKTARYNGKKYEATGKTELEAMTKLAEKLAAAKRGEETISGAMTVNSWYAQWKSTYKEPLGLTEKSLGMYDEKYRRYIGPRIGTMKLRDVRDTYLQKILNESEGRSASHVKKLRMILQEMFRQARRSRLISYDPSEGLMLPAVTQGKRRSITEAERRAILAVAEQHKDGLWIKTLLYTGMRPSETAALTWADVDFPRNEIHVHTARESGGTAIKGPKTAAGIRDIPIHAALLPALKKACGAPFSPVFPDHAGRFPDDDTVQRWWRSFKRSLDIYMGAEVYRNKITRSVVAQDLTPYCLRHTYCTDLQKAGVPINIAKELMGHSDIQTTANIYTHKDGETLHRWMSVVDGSGGNAGGNQISKAL